jgi:Zn-dependent peptidase ImmA (M78 family)
MFFLARKFRKIKLNRHVFSEADALELCEESGLNIIDEDIEQPGFYLKVNGEATIHINSQLRGLRRLYTILHELGHHLMHASNYQNAAFFCLDGQDSKQHHEAEAFALMAILPEPFLRRLLNGDLYDELGDYPKELVERRVRLLHTYGV